MNSDASRHTRAAHPLWHFLAALLFGVVFLGGGLGVWFMPQPEQTPAERMLLSLFPQLFVPLGLAVVVLALRRFQRLAFARSQARLHPQEPWRWKAEWQDDGVVLPERDHLPLLAALTLWPVLVAAPLVPAAPAAGVVALLSVCLTGWFAWRRLRTRLVLGLPVLHLETVPVRPGTVLRGELRIPRRLEPRTRVEVEFFCELSTRERIRARRVRLDTGAARQDAASTCLPVEFSIHEDAAGTTPAVLTEPEPTRLTHRWFIEVRAHSRQRPVWLMVPVFESRAL